MIDGPKPYSAMKDSGLEWLGNVPAHWSVLPLKRIAQFNGGSGFPVSTQGDTHEEILFAKVADMNRPGNEREITSSANTVSLEVARSLGAQVFERDTIIFPKVGGALLTNKRRLLVRETCIDNNLMGCVVRGASAAFTFRMLRWLDLARMAKPGPIPAISEGDVREIRVTIPPLPEQTAIVRYLDHADRRIRRYLLAKQKLIALLEEQKQAMIHEAVTGQIDVRTGRPYPTYKASGIEWLGDVPAHWEWRRLKTLLRRVDQRTVTGEETLLSLRRDHGVVIYAEHFHRPPQSSAFVGFKLVAVGQMVVNRLQANNGLVFCSGFDGVVSPDYSVFEMREALQMEYLSDLLRTSGYRSHFRRESTGLGTGTAGFLRLYDDKFLETEVFLPPAQEQVLILNSLANDMAKVRRLIEENRRQLQLMGEFRTRLIADVVTGKLDVREAAATLPEVDPLAADDDLDDTIDADNRPEFDNDEEVSELEY